MKEKSLQKLSKSDTKISKILSLDKIEYNDLKELSEVEFNKFLSILNETINSLKGDEREEFCQKIEHIMSETTKNQLWEYNNNQITWAISTLMQEYGRMPTKTEIATKTELSRQTIHKHLKEYLNHPLYLEQLEQFRFMSSKVLAKVFNYAVQGDLKAAKVFFNIIGHNSNGTSSALSQIRNQNNFIQINNTILSQEIIESLNDEQLNSIEAILTKIVSSPKK